MRIALIAVFSFSIMVFVARVVMNAIASADKEITSADMANNYRVTMAFAIVASICAGFLF